MFFPVNLERLKIGLFGSHLAFNLKLAQAHIEPEFYSESTILAEPVKKLQITYVRVQRQIKSSKIIKKEKAYFFPTLKSKLLLHLHYLVLF